MRLPKQGLMALLLVGAAGGWVSPASAEGVPVMTDQGVVMKRPVVERRMEERERIVYRPEVKHEVRQFERAVLVPVTEYRWEAYWAYSLNPFAAPQLAYRQVPYTRLEPRTEVVQQPTSSIRYVEEKQIEKTPVLVRRMATDSSPSRAANATPATGSTSGTARPAAPPASKAAAVKTTAPVTVAPATAPLPATPSQATPLVRNPAAIGGVERLGSNPPSLIKRY